MISADEFLKWCEVFHVNFGGGPESGVDSISGTANQVIVSNPTGDVVLSLPQSIAITSSPTFAALTLTAPLTGVNGGTGVANTGKTITIGGNLTTSGAFASTFTMTGTTTVTFPTTGTLATTATASGIINSGLINQVAYYAAAGTTLSGLATANNGTLITSAGGVPSISSTLPAAVQANITQVGVLAQNNLSVLGSGTNNSISIKSSAAQAILSFNFWQNTTTNLGAITAGINQALSNFGNNIAILNLTAGGVISLYDSLNNYFNFGANNITSNSNIGLVTGTNGVLTYTSTNVQPIFSMIGANAGALPTMNFYRNTTTVLGAVVAGINDAFSSNGDGMGIQNVIAGGKIFLRDTTGNALTVSAGVVSLSNPLPIASGGSGSASATGSGLNVLQTSPTLITPILGAATATSINFGGSTLSSYVDGTFAPLLTIGGSTTGITYTVAPSGFYSRIGNIVTCSIVAVLSSTGGLTGTLLITGMPFTSRTATNISFIGQLTGTFTYAGNFIYTRMGSATTTLQLNQNTTVTGITALNNTNISNTTDFYITATYLI